MLLLVIRGINTLGGARGIVILGHERMKQLSPEGYYSNRGTEVEMAETN